MGSLEFTCRDSNEFAQRIQKFGASAGLESNTSVEVWPSQHNLLSVFQEDRTYGAVGFFVPLQTLALPSILKAISTQLRGQPNHAWLGFSSRLCTHYEAERR